MLIRSRGIGIETAANLVHDLIRQKRLLQDLEIVILAGDLIFAGQLRAGHDDDRNAGRHLAQASRRARRRSRRAARNRAEPRSAAASTPAAGPVRPFPRSVASSRTAPSAARGSAADRDCRRRSERSDGPSLSGRLGSAARSTRLLLSSDRSTRMVPPGGNLARRHHGRQRLRKLPVNGAIQLPRAILRASPCFQQKLPALERHLDGETALVPAGYSRGSATGGSGDPESPRAIRRQRLIGDHRSRCG